MRALTLLFVAACASDAADPVLAAELALDRPSIDFQRVPCGASSTQSIVVHNPGSDVLVVRIDSTLPDVSLSHSLLEIEPLGSATVDVTAAIPQLSIPGHASRGDLVFASNVGTQVVAIAYEPTGAIVRFDQATIDFGTMLPGINLDRTLVVSVEGTESVSIGTGPVDGPFVAFDVTPQPIAPGETSRRFFDFRAPDAIETFATPVPITILGNRCGPEPELVLKAEVDSSLLSLDRTTLDFGRVACNTATGRDLIVTDNGPFITDYTVRFEGGHTGTLQGVHLAFDELEAFGTFASGVIAGQETIRFAVAAVPRDVEAPPGLYEHTVALGFNFGAMVRTVVVRGLLARPIPTLSTSLIDLGTLAVGAVVTRTFDITNDGNEVAPILLHHADAVSVSPSAFQLAPGATQTVTATITAGPQVFPTGVSFNDPCNTKFGFQSVVIHGTATN